MSGHAKPALIVSVTVAVVVGVLSSSGWSGEDPAPGEPKYAGAEVCATCHAQSRLGEQFQAWTGSMHARSYLVLATGYPEMIDRQARGMVDVGHGRAIAAEAERLGADTDCLHCHATGSEVDESDREPTFHVEDGVQCEACHGPGSAHAAAMGSLVEGQETPPEARLRRMSLDDCVRCHRHKPSHAVLERKPFEPAAAWKKIAHPLAGE
jgi:hypothetical protein